MPSFEYLISRREQNREATNGSPTSSENAQHAYYSAVVMTTIEFAQLQPVPAAFGRQEQRLSQMALVVVEKLPT
jgi:hypothetical protein